MISLNVQNKKHFALFQLDDPLDWHGDRIEWLDVLFFKSQEKLNKRLSRISPRRGKKEINKLLETVLSVSGSSPQELDQIAELLEAES